MPNSSAFPPPPGTPRQSKHVHGYLLREVTDDLIQMLRDLRTPLALQADVFKEALRRAGDSVEAREQYLNTARAYIDNELPAITLRDRALTVIIFTQSPHIIREWSRAGTLDQNIAEFLSSVTPEVLDDLEMAITELYGTELFNRL